MTRLSAAQMVAVEHGLVQDPPADDVEIAFTERDEGSYYAMARMDSSHPLAQTSQGYCEVYQFLKPGEKWHGAWYCMRSYLGGASGSAPYASREEAEARVRADVAASRRFWDGYAAMVGEDRTPEGEQVIRAGGAHYVVGKAFRGEGFGGHLWRLRLLATGEVIETRNLWMQGRIPSDYLGRMPDNAEVVPIEYPSFKLGEEKP